MAKNDRSPPPRQISGPEILDIDPDTGRVRDDARTEDLENDQDRLLNDIIQEFDATTEGVTYNASVTRIPKGYQRGQKEPWLFDVDAAEIHGIRAKLRDIYRGGIFRIRVYKSSGTGGGKLYRQFDYSIEVPDAAPISGGGIETVLAQALERQAVMMREMFEGLRSGPPQLTGGGAPDPLAYMERMSTIMANLGRGAGVAAPAENSLDTFMKAAEFVRDMQPGDSGKEPGWLSVLAGFMQNPKALETVGALLQQGRGQPPQQRRRMLAGQGQPQHEAPLPAAPQPGQEPNLGDVLGQNIRYLISRAERDADPALYAEWLLDNTDPVLLQKMAQDPGLQAQLESAFPRMGQYRPWFAELIEGVKQYMADPGVSAVHGENGTHASFGGTGSDSHDGSGGGGGDQGDTQNHGGAGAPVET